MHRAILAGKIHRATVTDANLNYNGSITVDKDLLDAAGLYEYELVQVVNVTTGARFETYTIAGSPNSGVICLNGAAARLVHNGDLVIIMAYRFVMEGPEKFPEPKVVLVDKDNRIVEVRG